MHEPPAMPIRAESSPRLGFGLLPRESPLLELGNRVLEMERQFIVDLTLRPRTPLAVGIAAETGHDDAFRAVLLPPSSAFESAPAVRRQARVCWSSTRRPFAVRV